MTTHDSNASWGECGNKIISRCPTCALLAAGQTLPSSSHCGPPPVCPPKQVICRSEYRYQKYKRIALGRWQWLTTLPGRQPLNPPSLSDGVLTVRIRQIPFRSLCRYFVCNFAYLQQIPACLLNGVAAEPAGRDRFLYTFYPYKITFPWFAATLPRVWSEQ